MRELILIELRELINQISEFHDRYGENDIRSSFLDGYFQILKIYYCAYYHLDSDDIMEKYYEIYNDRGFYREDIRTHLQGHKNVLNSYLIINCWSNFELFCTVFCNSVLSDVQRNELLQMDYLRIKKILKDTELSVAMDNKLKRFSKQHIAHVPMPNKYGKLLKLITPYPINRNKNNDREFLEFFGNLRNCIHSNYIYYGATDRHFTFNNEMFSFTSGQLVSHVPSTESSIYFLTKNIKEIFMVITESIIFDEEIYDPSVELLG